MTGVPYLEIARILIFLSGPNSELILDSGYQELY
jgi:hypothetical protein